MNKTVRLRIINAVEDLPKLITAHASVRGADFALAIKPHDGTCLSLFHTKEGTRIDASTVPLPPSKSKSLDAALKTMKGFQKVSGAKGPMTFRGRWTGTLKVIEGVPHVELNRKIASYGTLFISSSPDTGWTWRIERSEKWFSKLGNAQGKGLTIKDAVDRGTTSMMNLLGEACSFRDSRRRAAFDDAYAEKHPIKPAREGQDPIHRLERKASKRSQSKPKAKRKTTTQRKPKAQTSPRPSSKKANPKSNPGRAPIARQAALPSASMAETSPDPDKDAALMAAFADTLKALRAGG